MNSSIQRARVALLVALCAAVLAACAPAPSAIVPPITPTQGVVAAAMNDASASPTPESFTPSPMELQWLDTMIGQTEQTIVLAQDALDQLRASAPPLVQTTDGTSAAAPVPTPTTLTVLTGSVQGVVERGVQDLEQLQTWRNQWYPDAPPSGGLAIAQPTAFISTDSAQPLQLRVLNGLIVQLRNQADVMQQAAAAELRETLRSSAVSTRDRLNGSANTLETLRETWFDISG
jgi:hypothetical protein